jgi:hypothetical protein
LSAPRVGWSAGHGGSFAPELQISAAHDRLRHARALTDGDLLRVGRIVTSINTKFGAADILVNVSEKVIANPPRSSPTASTALRSPSADLMSRIPVID